MNIYLSTCVTEKEDDFRKKALIGPQFIHLLTTEPPQFPQVAENKISNKKNSKKLRIHRGLVSKQTTQKTNSKKIKIITWKCDIELNRNFPKEEIEMTKKYIFRCSKSSASGGLQINTTLRLHLTPLRMLCIYTYVQFSNNEHKN